MANGTHYNITVRSGSDDTPSVCFMSPVGFIPLRNHPDSVNQVWMFLSVVNGIASLPTVAINALIIWATLGDRNLRSSSFNLLLVALAVTDLFVGILVEPMFSLLLGCLQGNCYSPCKLTIYSLSSMVCCFLTVMTLALVSFERYLAIEYPIFYRERVTRKRVLALTVIVWTIVLTLMLTFTIFMNKNHLHLTPVPFLIIASICAVGFLYCSFKVQLTAYRQSKTIAKQLSSVQQSHEQQELEKQLQEYKRVFIITMLLVVSVLFYAPLIVVFAVKAVMGDNVKSDFKYIAMPIGVTFIHLQSLINPIVMSLRLSYIRNQIKNKLLCFTENSEWM